MPWKANEFFSSSIITTITLFNSELISLFVMSIHKSEFLLMQVCVPDSQWGQTNWRVLAKHFKSHIREEASQGTWSDHSRFSDWLMVREQGGGTISPEAPGPGAMCSLSASILHLLESFHMCFPGGSYGKVSACNEGDPGSIPGLGRSPGEGNGNPLQYSCLENSMDWRAW